MKVVLLDSQVISGYNYAIERKIVENAGFEFVMGTCKDEDEVVEKYRDADAILNIATKMTEKSISQLTNCQVMIRYGIGVNEFDMDAANKMGIRICNVTTYCISEVAIHATALALALSRQLKHFDQAVARGVWNQELGRKMRRPSAQTVGLVGFGNISRQIAKNFQGLGYSVVAYDPYVPLDVFKEKQVEQVDLETLYATADIISLHLPETKETAGMINAAAFNKMKDGVILINAARGGLIDTNDLVAALKAGKVGGAGLDTLSVEPMKDVDHPLLGMENVILTPHIAYNSAEANQELFASVAQTAVDVLNGENPANILNKKALNL
ncbi:C-terminal binding protein [Enterococcus hulanensis]|uniref:C-terminal binding protein n=1 Tax=Enterococcus hulanensis TaxID=2559929 RepID=UPI0028921904|nr:C-terminal binding protein [Enterococcus hulanensis]MDT2661313.1 C-terminal binding protein [Enterococcus hulanensis]